MANPDETKGRLKKAAGELTDDERLKREGAMDKAAGKVKDAVDRARAKADEVSERDEDTGEQRP